MAKDVEAQAAGPLSGPLTRPASARGGLRFAIALTAFEVVASVLVFRWALHQGASDVGAYLWATVAPLVGGLVYFVKSHDLSGASVAILCFNLLSAAVVVVGNTSPKMLLYKDCFATAVIGVIFLLTLVVGKPLAYHYGQRFQAGTSPEGIAWWRSLWAYPDFRRVNRQVTLFWGLLLLAESAVTALLVRLSSYRDGYLWDQLLPLVAGGVGALVTTWMVRRAWSSALSP